MNFIGTNSYARPNLARQNASCVYFGDNSFISVNNGLPSSARPESDFFQVIADINYESCYDRYLGETIPYHWQIFSPICDFPYHWNFPEYCLGGSTNGVCTDYYVVNECYDGFCPECERESIHALHDSKKSKYYIHPVPSQSEIYVSNTVIGDVVSLRNILGQELMRSIAKETKTSLLIDNFSPGIYQLIVNGEVAGKIIKY